MHRKTGRAAQDKSAFAKQEWIYMLRKPLIFDLQEGKRTVRVKQSERVCEYVITSLKKA